MNNRINYQMPSQFLLLYRELRRAHAAHLQGFENYGAKNWDGQGAKRVSRETLLKAREFLTKAGLPIPDAAPGIDGSIGLLWNSGPAYLYVDFRRDGRIHWYGKLAGRGAREAVAPRTIATEELLRKLNSFVQALKQEKRAYVQPCQANSVAGSYSVENMRTQMSA